MHAAPQSSTHTAPRSGQVLVVGSMNRDIVSYVSDLPAPGETVIASRTGSSTGGKGANQAIAAALAGAPTRMIGAVGDDEYGRAVTTTLTEAGVLTSEVETRQAEPTGVAHIAVARGTGENQIIVSSGANAAVRGGSSARRLDSVVRNPARDVIVMQAELGSDVLDTVSEWCEAHGAALQLNLAPYAPVSADALRRVRYLVVNEPEARMLVRALTAPVPECLGKITHALSHALDTTVIVTIGGDGALWRAPGRNAPVHHQPTPKPDTVVDTVGAGDTVCGVVAAAIAQGMPLAEAVRAGVHAGTLAVTMPGTGLSHQMPGLDPARLAAEAPPPHTDCITCGRSTPYQTSEWEQ